jgi:hypothetical protein
MEPDIIQIVGTWVAFLLTCMVYCYLVKDIPFFYAIYRIAVYVFIGVALGYGAIMAWHSVLVPRLLSRLEGGQWWYLVPLVLCLLLLTRAKRSWYGLSSITVAFLFGIGAALAVGGGLVGTLIPQVSATIGSLNPAHHRGIAAYEGNLPLVYSLNALLVALGTVSTLLYFYFTTESGSRRLARLRNGIVRLAASFGKVFIMFTFGALFATTAISRISLLVDRMRFIVETLFSLVPIT